MSPSHRTAGEFPFLFCKLSFSFIFIRSAFFIETKLLFEFFYHDCLPPSHLSVPAVIPGSQYPLCPLPLATLEPHIQAGTPTLLGGGHLCMSGGQ